MTNSPIIDFLAARRSVLARDLGPPGPSDAELSRLLEIGTRVPDHGRLEPWRFIVIGGENRGAAGGCLAEIIAGRESDVSEARLDAEKTRFTRAPLVICVVSRAATHPKIPEWEQVLSAGAVCQTLLIGAGAMGYGAQWITEWCAYDDDARAALGVGPHERVAGFIHIGTAAQKPAERPRPVVAELVTRWTPDRQDGAGRG